MKVLGYHPVLRYDYLVDGVRHTGRRLAFGFPTPSDLRRINGPLYNGEVVEVSFDPEEPARSTLLRGPVAEGAMIRMMLLASLLLAAGACLVALGFLIGPGPRTPFS